jgi:broad specificity phosphatase PhoE
MTSLCLVRHGQTKWNLEGRYQGQSDTPLNENGRIQARLLAQKLRDFSFEALYTSDLQRTRETAAIIGKALDVPVTLEPRLREINQGEWEGQLVEDIRERYAKLWQQRTIDPAGLRPPGGETVAEVAARVYAALDDIARQHPGVSVIIVSHGISIATAICRVRAIPVGQAYTVIPSNADPVWVDWEIKSASPETPH